jgi:hypothetical protein
LKKPIHIEADFLFGEIVYHKTGDGEKGIVTGIKKAAHGGVTYYVSFNGRSDTEHFALELTRDKPIDGVEPTGDSAQV